MLLLTLGGAVFRSQVKGILVEVSLIFSALSDLVSSDFELCPELTELALGLGPLAGHRNSDGSCLLVRLLKVGPRAAWDANVASQTAAAAWVSR